MIFKEGDLIYIIPKNECIFGIGNSLYEYLIKNKNTVFKILYTGNTMMSVKNCNDSKQLALSTENYSFILVNELPEELFKI
jgi:hypothetical protein